MSSSSDEEKCSPSSREGSIDKSNENDEFCNYSKVKSESDEYDDEEPKFFDDQNEEEKQTSLTWNDMVNQIKIYLFGQIYKFC